MSKIKKCGTVLWEFLERAMRFAVSRIFHIHLSEDTWDKILQFIKFGMVGLSNTVISYVVYVVLLLAFQHGGLLPHADYLVAQFIAFVLSVLWSFYWNRKYVFEVESGQIPWVQALIKTYISYAFTGIFLNSVLSVIWVQWIGIPKLVAPVINLLVSVPVNFVLNKFWAFRGKE